MNAPGPHQTFGLGTLIGQYGSETPVHTAVQIDGRGVFATVRLTFELAPGGEGEERLFLLETPWDAVLCELSCDGRILEPHSRPVTPSSLAATQLQAVEAELSGISCDLTVLDLPAGQEVKTVAMEFLLALDLLWHRGGLAFRARGGTQKMDFGGRWDLTGLTGAGISFSRAAAPCRVETLEGARYRWSEPLTISSEEQAWLDFSLDEKKAASVAVFSPTPEDESRGSAAVAVIAPVRAQLAREPVRLAIMVEARNPQEILLLRQMVEGVSEILRPGDELSLWLLGTDSPGGLVSWTAKEAVTEAILARLLEPSVIGRAPDLWANLAQLDPQTRGATHIVMATNGAEGRPAGQTLGGLPVFIFATGRKPYRGALEGLAQRSGGALCAGTAESVEIFVERLKVRLSPPLLSDFKLEGWGLEQILPSGTTQVYSDQPTLVLGQHSGLLPKTVTLSGLSPSRQKLAQRVRVETLPELDLAPLYADRQARWEGQGEQIVCWADSEIRACRLSHPSHLSQFFVERQEIRDASSANTLSMDLFAAPAISVSFGEPAEGLSGAADFFGSDTFEGPPPSSSSEPDLFQSDSFFSGPSSDGPVVIFKESPEQGGGAEPELFEDPSELTPAAPVAEEERPFEVPSGPPMIVRSQTLGEDEEEESEESTPPSSSFEDPSGKRRLASWRQRGETPTIAPATPEESSSKASRKEQPETDVPEWLEKLHALEPERARGWLESCAIDLLGLAASLMDAATAESLLARLSPLRQRAVRTQMAWGSLLETYEREQADRQLSLSLTQELISS